MRLSRFTRNSMHSVDGHPPSIYGKRTLTWENPEIVGGLP